MATAMCIYQQSECTSSPVSTEMGDRSQMYKYWYLAGITSQPGQIILIGISEMGTGPPTFGSCELQKCSIVDFVLCCEPVMKVVHELQQCT